MQKSERIEITDENADALIEQYAGEWMTANEIASLFAGLSRSTIHTWSSEGAIRSREIIPRPQYASWLKYSVTDAIKARHRRKRCKPFLRRRKSDGSMEYRCNVCEEWKSEDDFYDNVRPGRDNHQKLTYCKSCHNRRMQKRRSEYPEVKAQERKRFREKYERQRKQMKAAVAWKARAEVEASKVIEMIDAAYPNETDVALSEASGMHADSIRTVRRRARDGGNVKIERAEKILIALDMKGDATRLIDEAWGEQPQWHKDWAYCQRCFRINVTYMARGLCSTCYRKRDDPTYQPPVETGWSMRYPFCQSCRRIDRKHAARGLCVTCWQRQRKSGELKPATTGRGAHRRSKAVGSEYGNPLMATQEQKATPDGGGRRDDQGR